MEDVVRVGTEPLDVAAALLEVQDPGAGASAVFVGTTRNHFGGTSVHWPRLPPCRPGPPFHPCPRPPSSRAVPAET